MGKWIGNRGSDRKTDVVSYPDLYIKQFGTKDHAFSIRGHHYSREASLFGLSGLLEHTSLSKMSDVHNNSQDLYHPPNARFQNGTRMYKVVLMGEGGVGKSCESG